MKLGNILLLAALLSFLFASPAADSAPKTVMVYYMPWYSAKPYSDNWGWHWTMDHFNPDLVGASGERQIASWYYPLIGPYDSSDPTVLEYHVLLMKLAGVDGVIVDWYGSANFLDYGLNNQATMKLFEFTRRAGLKFSVCYEDQTIQHMLDEHYLAASDSMLHAQQEMLYLQTNFFTDPSYFRLNGRPILLNFGPQHFMASSNWGGHVLRAGGDQPAGILHRRQPPVCWHGCLQLAAHVDEPGTRHRWRVVRRRLEKLSC